MRALILTSSRAIPGAPVDAFSDYDVILVVTEIRPFLEDKSWLGDFGAVLVVYHDPPRIFYRRECFREIAQYENGLKIDFSVMPPEVLSSVAVAPQLPEELYVGYRVLLDKDGIGQGLKPPTYRAHIPKRPTQAEYLRLIEEFFSEAAYVAKHLWRDDLLPAKYNLDHTMKHLYLYKMFIWRFETDQNWSVKPGDYGKGLKRQISPERWRRLEDAYAGADIEGNWDALFRTVTLFREIAGEVGERLGYVYPAELHRRCVRYFERIGRLDRGVTDVVAALALE